MNNRLHRLDRLGGACPPGPPGHFYEAREGRSLGGMLKSPRYISIE
jgi:hypothetical protein